MEGVLYRGTDLDSQDSPLPSLQVINKLQSTMYEWDYGKPVDQILTYKLTSEASIGQSKKLHAMCGCAVHPMPMVPTVPVQGF